MWFAYFEPYSQERHLDFIAQSTGSPFAELLNLGCSMQGRSIDLIRVSKPEKNKKNVWIIARQHPGESMAAWCAQGLLQRLLDEADPIAREIRESACLYIVPNVNPDGAFLGHLRTNAAGINLNREWRSPSLERSPEVFYIQKAMQTSGVDLFLDLHGDEILPYVFISGSHMVPHYSAENLKRQKDFLDSLREASPDFQTEYGYCDSKYSEELLTLASKWASYAFDCVGLTVEMPFKDNANAPDARYGWNGARSECFGAALLVPILRHVKMLAKSKGV